MGNGAANDDDDEKGHEHDADDCATWQSDDGRRRGAEEPIVRTS